MNNSLYFSHDYTASNDVKMLFLRQDLGAEGYGLYWLLIEHLAQQNGKLPIKIIPLLARQFDTSEDKINDVIHKYDLFVIEDNLFFSKRLLTTIDLRETLTAKGKEAAAKRWAKENQPKQMIL